MEFELKAAFTFKSPKKNAASTKGLFRKYVIAEGLFIIRHLQ